MDDPVPRQAPVRGRGRGLLAALAGRSQHRERGPRPAAADHGRKDHTVPEAITKSTVKQYRHSDAVTDLVEFADRGHSLTIDSGWREVADACLAWLNKQGL